LSEIVKLRGRVSSVRVGCATTHHVFPQLDPAGAGKSAGQYAAPPAGYNGHSGADLDAVLMSEYERGRVNGIREAENSSVEEMTKRTLEETQKVQAVLASLHKQLDMVLARVEREAYRFAVAVAGRIVKREVTLDDEVVVRQIQEALRRVAGIESVKVKLNPHDEALVRQHRDMLTAGSESVRELVIETDDKIERGGCILETTSGTVDAELSAQLGQIEAALFGQAAT